VVGSVLREAFKLASMIADEKAKNDCSGWKNAA
jgi:hypothetical protein